MSRGNEGRGGRHVGENNLLIKEAEVYGPVAK